MERPGRPGLRTQHSALRTLRAGRQSRHSSLLRPGHRSYKDRQVVQIDERVAVQIAGPGSLFGEPTAEVDLKRCIVGQVHVLIAVKVTLLGRCS